MRIKRLDICGFKSFMDRAVFTFHDGVTGVVGPNGCGKSNVVDAIRWAMGEQSAKNLRGRAMEDVIFNGSESKPPLGMAEVTLTFHNDTPELLPAQYRGFADISVTRRLFRNGDSEYLINKTPCRLLDVTELFLGTGVGTKAYSIIEQGRIGLIVSAKPEDRRALIEEAAGITRYKSRRKAAERKMEHTEQNLLRVGDIVNELGKRLESLNRQARKAEKYKRLKAEMREIELHTASLRWLELTALSRAARAAIEGMGGEERELADKVLAADAKIEALRARVAADERALAELAERAHQADSELQVGRANLDAWQREIEQTSNRLAEAERELAEVEAAQQQLTAEHEALETQRASLDGLATDDEKRMIEVRDVLSSLLEEEAALSARLEHERALLVSALSRIAAGKSHLENLARQRTDLEGRIAAALAEREELRERAAELERAREGFLQKLGTSRQLKLDLEQRRAGEEEALERARREFMENEAQLIQLREELSDRRSRLNSLREIEKNYEGYGRGVRAVMQHAGDRGRERGVFGLVADVVRANAEVERAIEAALGDKLQTIVVADQDKALSLAGYLREAKEGRGAFLPLTVTAPEPQPADTSIDGVIGAALDLVEYEAEYAPLVKHLLGNVVVVRDLDAAVAYSKNGRPQTVVTLDGDVIEPTGGVVGGMLEGPGVGALHKKREIAELAERVAVLQTEHQVCLERHRRLGERIQQIEGALKGLSDDTHSEALTVVEQEKDLHKTSEDLARARERYDRLTAEIEAMQRALSEMAAEETSAAGGSAQAESERESREAKVRELSEALAGLRARTADLNAERTDLQVKVAADFERRESIEKNLERTATTLTELGERRARLEQTIKEARSRRTSLEEKVVGNGDELEKLEAELAGMTARQQQARAEYEELAAQARAEETETRAVRKRLEELQSGRSAQALKEREYALELGHLQSTIQERHGVDIAVELHRFHQLPPPSPEMQEKLRGLREQVERMGEINLTAIEEHAQLAERHSFLLNQKKDLEQSLNQLRKAIVRINRTSKDRFQQTFEAVKVKFEQVFPRLFNGGRASLELVQNEDGSEPGIEILAQPPGKKLQSVNLLSGGEKALTAVALIFAIFLIKPTPFCLLDEVDAPLDEANVGRYNELVREMSKISQFILITHNKRTMQIADAMYGVTMEEPGISKIVSVKMSEQAQAATPASA
jgi:chromosome segregation protein